MHMYIYPVRVSGFFYGTLERQIKSSLNLRGGGSTPVMSR